MRKNPTSSSAWRTCLTTRTRSSSFELKNCETLMTGISDDIEKPRNRSWNATPRLTAWSIAGADHASLAQPRDACRFDTPVGQCLLRAVPVRLRRRRQLRPGATEARCRCRLHHAPDLDEGAARPVVRMAGRLGDREHRSHARIRAFEEAAPFGGGPGRELLGDDRL